MSDTQPLFDTELEEATRGAEEAWQGRPSGDAMSDAPLQFWKEYLLQTRKEIDLEKTEGTRILHLKILLIGALLILVRGPAGLAAFLLLPLVMLALDLMQLSRLHYILHRWEYLESFVVPKLRAALANQDARFFEETVIERHRQGFYLPLEALVRTLLFVPVLAVSSVSASLLVAQISYDSVSGPYLSGLGWLAVLTAITLRHRDVYRLGASVVVAILTVIVFVLDWAVAGGSGLKEMVKLFKGGA